jgi:hypothetical protein
MAETETFTDSSRFRGIDRKRTLPAVESHRVRYAGKTQTMVPVPVRYKYIVYLHQVETGGHQLSLGPFAAIKKTTKLLPVIIGKMYCRMAPFRCGDTGGRPEYIYLYL